jgi:hypothetical protein
MAQVITLTEAAKLSNNLLVEGVIEDIITINEWYRHLPFVVFEGLAYTFTREKTIGKAAFAAPGTNLNSIKFQKGATMQNVNVSLAAIIGDIIMDGQIEDQLSDHNDQLQVQISSKAKDIARTYMNAIINGKRYPGGPLIQSNNGPIGIEAKFDGMKMILDAESGNVDDVNHPFYNAGLATQTLELLEDDPASSRSGRAGRVFTLEDLDNLIDRVTTGKPDFLMMHARDIRTLRVLLRNTGGGTDAFQIQQMGLGNMKPMLMYQEIPVFRNDFISKTEPVNLIGSGVVAAAGAASITTDLNYAGGVPVALSDGITAGTAVCIVRGDDLILRKYKITVASVANPSILTVVATGSFLDVENNILEAQIAPNDGSLVLTGKDYAIYERTDGSEIYVGRWGEMEGVVGFTSANDAGVVFEFVGPRENENAYQYRLKWYCGFDLYNRLALARIKYALPLGA